MKRFAFASVLCLASMAFAGRNDVRVDNLRCEYLVNPTAVEAREPRLNWTLQSEERAQKQTAYRVLVASSAELLKKDKGDLWDSGKVASDETTCIVYAGKPLESFQPCFWKVQVWDKSGKRMAWSKDACWSMGLRCAQDWKAQWIGYDKARKFETVEAPLQGAKWIWSAADPKDKAPAGHRLFTSTFTIPEDAKIERAELVTVCDDKGRFTLNGQMVLSMNGWKESQLRSIIDFLKPGANDLRAEVQNMTEGPAGFIAIIQVKTTDGKTYTHVTDESWKVQKSYANWHKLDLNPAKFGPVRIVGEYGMAPWGKATVVPVVTPPASYLRTAFNADKPVRRAMLYTTALGIHDVYLNGRRVNDGWFNPGWTDYAKRVYYRAYDVTADVKSGRNAFGAILADGWYSGYIGYKYDRNHYGKNPRFAAQLRLEYADGSVATVATGPEWKASTGPILGADFLMGETYDARRELAGWNLADYSDKGWDAVVVGAEVKPVVQAHPAPPVRTVAEFKAIKMTEPRKGAWVLDLGQNFAGVARLTVNGAPGQVITLRFAERLNPDGTIYTTNLRSARCTDTYICKGGGTEVWEPRFTFHGFQYVEITGLTSSPAPDTVVGLAVTSDTPVVGTFASSDAMLNRLHKNIYWTQAANFIDIPTDCPQRDERLGWTGDAQVYIRTATLNTDVQAFFTKWLVDLVDAQRADGQFPMVAPLRVAEGDGGPAWAEAGVICPWTVYEVYGDKRLLERQYPTMKKYVEFCKNRSTADLLPPEKFHCFGDWLSIKADTPKDVICTAYFAYATKLTARAAEVLGKTEDAAALNELFNRIKASFNKAYVAADGRIKGNTQCVYVLAIAFDLLDAEKFKLAARYLVEDIEGRGNHLSTGFIGTKDLMLALAKIGRNDVAYKLMHNDTFPSWGFSIKHGATSIWERWDGWTPENGFQTPGMNSFAHYSFGAVYQWMVENIGGIRSEGVGYKKIVIAPQPGGKLTSAKIGYASPRGQIASDWKREGDKLLLTVTVPVNTTATVIIPAARAEDVTESGKPLKKAEGVKLVKAESGQVVLAVGSGTYRFAAAGK